VCQIFVSGSAWRTIDKSCMCKELQEFRALVNGQLRHSLRLFFISTPRYDAPAINPWRRPARLVWAKGKNQQKTRKKLVCLRIAYPEWKYFPTAVFAVAAVSVVSWMQAKRFFELSTSYSLATHEISIIRTQVDSISTEKEFSNFVNDTENAFSREHTQWVARRDTWSLTFKLDRHG